MPTVCLNAQCVSELICSQRIICSMLLMHLADNNGTIHSSVVMSHFMHLMAMASPPAIHCDVDCRYRELILLFINDYLSRVPACTDEPGVDRCSAGVR